MTNITVYRVSADGVVQAVEVLSDSKSLNEAQQRLPEGVYTTFRTFRQTQAVRIGDHFSRLRESAALLEKPIEINETKVRASIAAILKLQGYSESRVRLSVDLENNPGDLYVVIEPLSIPSHSDYENGVSALTRQLHRDNPKVKSTLFVRQAETVKAGVGSSINEIIMFDENGLILEGLSSNFFAVLNGVVWTANEGVLSGITRDIVIDVLRNLNINCIQRSLPRGSLIHIEEIFITSASRGVLPVTRVDDRVIGNGKPGPITQTIRSNYEATINKIMEPI